MSIDPATLAALPVFRGISADAIAALAERGNEVTYPSGAVLFRAGDSPRGWYIVLEGRVRVVRGSDARQHVVHTETAGGTMGEVPLFGGLTHPATGIASEPTRCALFDRRSLEELIAQVPEIGYLINKRLALRVRGLVERLDDRSQSVRRRLAEFLLERLRVSPNADRFSVGMTQQALAEELGTVREVISREMKTLVADRVIESLGGGRYHLLDVDALRRRTATLG